MTTILAPVDFSAPSKNAAIYALNLAKQLSASKVVLYNAYQAPPIITEPAAMPAIPLIDIDTLKGISADSIMQFKGSLQEFCPEGIELDYRSEYGILANDIDEVCNDTGAELIVMGITGSSKIEEVLIGSTATSVVKHTKVPVIIVPDGATFTAIQNIALASDFKKVAETTPVQVIKRILNETNATLHVLNVSEGEKSVESKSQGKELLQSLLQECDPQFHFVDNTSFIDGINNFVDANNIDLIITIPKKHGFFDGLFKERHTKKLAFHSHVPLMFIHQEDL